MTSQMTNYPPPGAPDQPPSQQWGQSPQASPYPAPHPSQYAPPYPQQAPQQAPPPPGAVGAPGPWGPPVHQPGVVPLRPLTLGDIFGGALQTIRRNPRATVGMAALVTFGFMLLPILGTLLLGVGGLVPDIDPLSTDSTESTAANVGLLVTSAIAGIFGTLSSIVVTGLIVRVVQGALVGRRVTMGTAWSSARGRLLPLLGLVLLVAVGLVVVLGLPIAAGVLLGMATGSTLATVLLGVAGTLVGLAVTVFLYVRYVLLAAPVLVLDGTGIRGSLARAGRLARGQFWRLLGIYLLANLAASFVGQVIAIPFAIAGVVGAVLVPGSWGLVTMLLLSHFSTVLTGALIGPFTASVMALQYYDQRFRKEGLDIELLNQTLGGSTGNNPLGHPAR